MDTVQNISAEFASKEEDGLNGTKMVLPLGHELNLKKCPARSLQMNTNKTRN